MPDNISIPEATGGSLLPIATDEIAGVHYPRQKLGYGADGSYGDCHDGNPLPVKLIPVAAGVALTYRNLDVQPAGATVKTSAGQVFGIVAQNTSGTAAYLKLYNKASNPAVASDTPVMTLFLPAGQSLNFPFLTGLPFSTGIALCATAGVADTNAVAPGANAVITNVVYR